MKASPCTKGAQRGFSLVELMVALVIGLFVMAGVGSIFVTTKETDQLQKMTRRMLENGRYAMDLIASDLRRAGYWGGNLDASLISGTAGKAAAANTCVPTDTSWGRMVDQPLFGLDDTNAGYSCVPNASYLRGDILVLRYASESATNAFSPNRLYLRSSLFEGRIFKGSDQASNLVSDTPQSTRELVAHAFYVAPSDQECPAGTPIPALMMETLSDDGRPIGVQQVIGVEHLAFRYGVDRNGDGSVETYLDADAVTDWTDVAAVQFWMLFRADCAIPAFTDTNTYLVGDQSYTPGDSFPRRLQSLTVALRN